MERFTIRPKPGEDESLTSYLYRLTHVNKCAFVQLAKACSTGPKNKRQSVYKYYKFDFSLENNYDTKKLSKITGLEKDEILLMTVHFYHRKFNEAKNIINREFEKKTRRYCPDCLHEGSQFKLIWQVYEIDICNIHKNNLLNYCMSCKQEFPYINEKVIIEKKCFNCGESIKLNRHLKSICNGADERRKYEDWSFLLDKDTKMPIINGYSPKNSLAITFIYWVRIQNVRIETIPRFMNFINTLKKFDLKKKNRSLTPSNLLKALRYCNTSIDDFCNTKVNQKIIKETLFEKEKDEIPKCEANWCRNFLSKKGMEKIMLHRAGPKYFEHYICMECCVTYAKERSTNKWRDIYNIINLYNQVVNRFINKEPLKEIMKVTGISSYKIQFILGYIMNRDSDIKKYYGHFCKDEENFNKMINVFQKTRRVAQAKNIALANYKWNEIDFFYYFHNKDFQCYLSFLYIRPNRNNEKKNYLHWRNKVKKCLRKLLASDTKITISLVSAEIGLNRISLLKYRLNRLIISVKELQWKETVLKREQLIQMQVSEYIKRCKGNKKKITICGIEEELNITNITLKRTYPKVSTFIQNELQTQIRKK
jgi:hypothetical protein